MRGQGGEGARKKVLLDQLKIEEQIFAIQQKVSTEVAELTSKSSTLLLDKEKEVALNTREREFKDLLVYQIDEKSGLLRWSIHFYATGRTEWGWWNPPKFCKRTNVYFIKKSIVVKLQFIDHSFFNFLKAIFPAQMLAFSTSSSAATLPLTMKRVEKNLNVSDEVTSFVCPLGATINMDGTAIMQGVATVFIENAYSLDLLFVDYLMVILTATLASIGTAGVPGVGLIMLAMVLNQVGLPVEGIALIIGVDRLLDMLRTVVNVTGDSTVSTIVANSENQLERTKL